jgi:hypothetical protein
MRHFLSALHFWPLSKIEENKKKFPYFALPQKYLISFSTKNTPRILFSLPSTHKYERFQSPTPLVLGNNPLGI